MPRVAGQIDVAKNEAILDAALQVLGERGTAASMEEIARRAGVSKQTVYNHYGSKADLVRAMCARRVSEMTAPLEAPGALEQPEETLAAYGRALLQGLLNPRSVALMRTAVAGVATQPDVARTIHESGIRANRRRFAAFLAAETAAGRLACPDPMAAAEVFSGMVVGVRHVSALLDAVPPPDEAEADRIARDAAARFLVLFGA
ncbi:MAG: transcriptional regulator, TetR family [Phenylobacterium sp.]|jgi:TetR/AcrR family transcriptional repressor of mexJK operon|nr:transcriptional regulator, TetR family [Phenylobacterium sp.]